VALARDHGRQQLGRQQGLGHAAAGDGSMKTGGVAEETRPGRTPRGRGSRGHLAGQLARLLGAVEELGDRRVQAQPLGEAGPGLAVVISVSAATETSRPGSGVT
jgi:hypothetical protein